MSGANSRRAAADLLIEVLERRRTLDDALLASKAYDALEGPDRGFARAMASAALRHLGIIDRGLQSFLNRPLESANPEARALLRIGAAQIWCLDTPNHAAVGETVEAAKNWGKAGRATGLINAVLRKLGGAGHLFKDAEDTQIWPDWLKRAFIDSLGAERTARLASAQRHQPHLHLTLKSGKPEVFTGKVAGSFVHKGQLALEGGQVETLPGFDSGDWWVQDAAAALPARLMNAGPDDTVVDMCAAPGGKTMQLAATGANVVAIDRSAKRLERVRENLRRTGLEERVDIIAGRGEDFDLGNPASHILLDAPCSALGTLRRHPEGAWIKRPKEIAGYPEIQAALLNAAIRISSPGGLIVYCVCSPLRAEGRDVVAGAIQSGGVERSPIEASEVPGFEPSITLNGDLLTVPDSADAQHDAFYISRLRVL